MSLYVSDPIWIIYSSLRDVLDFRFIYFRDWTFWAHIFFSPWLILLDLLPYPVKLVFVKHFIICVGAVIKVWVFVLFQIFDPTPLCVALLCTSITLCSRALLVVQAPCKSLPLPLPLPLPLLFSSLLSSSLPCSSLLSSSHLIASHLISSQAEPYIWHFSEMVESPYRRRLPENTAA